MRNGFAAMTRTVAPGMRGIGNLYRRGMWSGCQIGRGLGTDFTLQKVCDSFRRLERGCGRHDRRVHCICVAELERNDGFTRAAGGSS